MTRQAVELLLFWGKTHTMIEQRNFAEYLAKLLEEHYHPKQVLITGRTMEAIMDNYEREIATPPEVATY